MGPGGEGWGPAFLFVSLYKNLLPDPVSGNCYGRLPRSRAGRRRAQACGARRRRPASVRGRLCGLRTRTRRGGDDGGSRRVETRWRGAARRARGVETMAPSSPPPVLDAVPHRLAMRFLATVPVGAALETPAASNLRVPTRPMARAPVGNAKTHSTPSHYDGVEHR